MNFTDLPDLVPLAQASPVAVRAAIGVLGIALCFAGAKVYKTALWLVPFAVGAVVVGAGAAWAGRHGIPDLLNPWILGGLSLIGGGVVMMLAERAHGAVLMMVGGLVGITVGTAMVKQLGTETLPPWTPLAGAILGGLVFPPAFELMLRLLTAVIGAVLVVWAAAMPNELIALAGLSVAGAVAQVAADFWARDDD